VKLILSFSETRTSSSTNDTMTTTFSRLHVIEESCLVGICMGFGFAVGAAMAKIAVKRIKSFIVVRHQSCQLADLVDG